MNAATSPTSTSKPTRVFLEGVRICYVNLHAPKVSTRDDGEIVEQYAVQALIPKGRKSQLGLLRRAVAAAKLGAGRPEGEKYKNAAVRDGDQEQEDRPRPETKGMFFLNARNNTQPICLDRNNIRLTDPKEIRDKLYSGALCDMLVTAFYYAAGPRTKGNKGVTWSVEIVRKRADMPRLDGRATVDDMPAPTITDEGTFYVDYGFDPPVPSDMVTTGGGDENEF
jgi:hypothetical protein